MTEDSLFKAVKEIEKAVGLNPGFLSSLTKEDDWSFVIKVHALVEAAITHLLTVKGGNERLANVYALLELSDTRRGKLAFVRELDLLDEKYRRLIRQLSEIRNRLIHDVRNVGITLGELLGRLDKQQRKNFIDAILLDYESQVDDDEKDVPIRQVIAENPKAGIWMAVMDLLGSIYIQKQYLEMRTAYVERTEEFAKRVIALGLKMKSPPVTPTKN